LGNKTNKLNIYLIKEDFSAPQEIVKPGYKEHAIGGVGTLFLHESHAKPPTWLKDFFLNELDGLFVIFSAGAKAVLLVKIPWNGTNRTFVIAFGYGRLILRDGVTEERFGLKVVLNSVDPKSLRSIDKTSLGAIAKQSREQISHAGETASFGIDIEQDLVNSVTGRSRIPLFGKTISGRDSLSIAVKIDLSDVCSFLPKCLQQYESNDYKTDFDWIDQIRDIRDPTQRDQLNENLLERLKNGDLDRVWMAPPSVLDWVDIKGFRYSKAKSSDLKDDLEIKDFLSGLSTADLTIGTLKSRPIYAISSTTETEIDHWNAYSCLYAETVIGDRVFILNQGKWYEIQKDFSKLVIQDYDAILESQIPLPHYAHASEGE